jgi:hypothetical protein
MYLVIDYYGKFTLLLDVFESNFSYSKDFKGSERPAFS